LVILLALAHQATELEHAAGAGWHFSDDRGIGTLPPYLCHHICTLKFTKLRSPLLQPSDSFDVLFQFRQHPQRLGWGAFLFCLDLFGIHLLLDGPC